MKICSIEATTISDAWFQALFNLMKMGRTFLIDKGSNAGQTRREFDYFTARIKCPTAHPILPEMPEGSTIPPPVDPAYIWGGKAYNRSYIEYLMTPTKQPDEAYTYGERLTKFRVSRNLLWYSFNDKLLSYTGPFPLISENGSTILWIEDYDENNLCFNQIEWVIYTYRKYGHRNNQLVLQVASPDDHLLTDPPCLRSIDTRIQDGKLYFFVYFRSWDLWGGFPANLAGIQVLQTYMATEIGVEVGEMLVESKGLHIYGYAEEVAELRTLISK